MQTFHTEITAGLLYLQALPKPRGLHCQPLSNQCWGYPFRVKGLVLRVWAPWGNKLRSLFDERFGLTRTGLKAKPQQLACRHSKWNPTRDTSAILRNCRKSMKFLIGEGLRPFQKAPGLCKTLLACFGIGSSHVWEHESETVLLGGFPFPQCARQRGAEGERFRV